MSCVFNFSFAFTIQLVQSIVALTASALILGHTRYLVFQLQLPVSSQAWL